MTVRQLIEALKDLPQDYIVRTEGCDCDGSVARVKVYAASSSRLNGPNGVVLWPADVELCRPEGDDVDDYEEARREGRNQ